MMAFDPDAYLSSKNEGFDPDAYLESRGAQTKEQAPPERSLGGKALHQAGLTVRDIIEGGAETVGILSDPLAYMSNKALGTNMKTAGSVGRSVADTIGLPSPENATERVVNNTAKLLVGTGGIIKGASKAAGAVASPIARSVLKSIASVPEYQAASAVGSGVAGGVAKENDVGAGGQFAASLAGGIAAPVALYTGKAATNTLRSLLKPEYLDNKVSQVLQGLNLSNIPQNIQQTILQDVKEAVKTGKDLSPSALRRLVDYRTVGATPIRSSLTLNPADITRDRNLAKLSANSRDPAAQKLSNLQRENDQTLVKGLNTLGAEGADDAVTAGNKIIQALDVKDTATKKVIDSFYKQARDSNGRSIPLDRTRFNEDAINNLVKSNKIAFLPAEIKTMMNNIAKGQVSVDGVTHDVPFDVNTIDSLRTTLASASQSKDGNVRAAVKIVSNALDNTQPVAGTTGESMAAFNKARSSFKTYMGIVDKTPALKAVRDGVEPDKFMQTYILGSGGKTNIADVKALRESLKNNDEAVLTIRNQIVSHLKNKATGGNADEVANFSPSNFNKALQSIGDAKLNLFFTKEDVNMLKTIGRVGSYEKFQPTGSAVNNSNTAASAVTSILDWLANSPVVRKIPIGGSFVANNAQDIRTSIAVGKSTNTLNALLAPKVKTPSRTMLPIAPLLYGSSTTSE